MRQRRHKRFFREPSRGSVILHLAKNGGIPPCSVSGGQLIVELRRRDEFPQRWLIKNTI